VGLAGYRATVAKDIVCSRRSYDRLSVTKS
jgi:hypothetical protein